MGWGDIVGELARLIREIMALFKKSPSKKADEAAAQVQGEINDQVNNARNRDS